MDLETTIQSLPDDEAEYALGLDPEDFWAWWFAREV